MKSVKNIALLLATFLNLLYKSSLAQCSVSSERPPGTVTETNLSGSDFGWDDASDVLTSNNDYAYAGATLTLLNPSKYSNYMTLTNFSMSIPAAVTICGIVVQIDRKASGLSLGAVVRDYRVRLVKGGAITGNNNASGSGWAGSETTATYGSSSDLWGTTWTPADINSGNFGFALSAEISGLLGVFLSADIDNVRITVYYQHIVLPVTITGFQGTQKGNAIELTWETKAEHGIKKFIVERQSSHSSWETIHEIDAANTMNEKKTFRAYDLRPQTNNNYRLKLIDKSNNVSYSEISNVKLKKSSDDLIVDVNSSNKTILVFSSEPIVSCKIFRADGSLINLIKNSFNKNQLAIHVNSLPEGNFILHAETRRKRIARQINVGK
ncbi:fibronectin type III domain-containing protein [Lacibacter sediminis]|uniref:T9SS type A sorting domain-containing protein n=1 Tax=Lacibacter sediminis TaxID=2760713 RepID=A0A7G5XL09_9BACT|nr:hypothetical protein [Lacibacter sediminis]QNA46162.1 hypothetical protein H4075_08270 [Lacibacter sediminis]